MENKTGLNKLAEDIHVINREKGFWDKERNVGEMLMLITSELGEAMEAHRKGRFTDREKFLKDVIRLEKLKEDKVRLVHEQRYEDVARLRDKERDLLECMDQDVKFEKHVKDTFEDEIADAMIRILDMAAGLDIDLEWHVAQKLEYNKKRERLHGKRY